MKITIKTRKGNLNLDGRLGITMIVLLGLLGLWVALLSFPQLSYGAGDYNETFLTNTTVNITNSAAEITFITFQDNVELNAYNVTNITCNVTIFDFDNDSVNVVGRLYIENVSQPSDTDDNNYKYTNSNCSRTSAQDQTMNYSCNFLVQYYADNSSNWLCNATVSDGGNVNRSNISNFGVIEPLVAIKVADVIDYGDLEVGEISSPIPANITNAGNRNVNISVDGWADTDDDGLAFNCTFGIIDQPFERYAISNETAFSSMTQITDTSTLIPNFPVQQRTDDSAESINQTWWKVQIPVGAGGVCNGKVLFTASDRLD